MLLSESLGLLGSSTSLRDRLEENAKYFEAKDDEAGFKIVPGEHPIVPVMLYEAALHNSLLQDSWKKAFMCRFLYPDWYPGKQEYECSCLLPTNATSGQSHWWDASKWEISWCDQSWQECRDSTNKPKVNRVQDQSPLAQGVEIWIKHFQSIASVLLWIDQLLYFCCTYIPGFPKYSLVHVLLVDIYVLMLLGKILLKVGLRNRLYYFNW